MLISLLHYLKCSPLFHQHLNTIEKAIKFTFEMKRKLYTSFSGYHWHTPLRFLHNQSKKQQQRHIQTNTCLLTHISHVTQDCSCQGTIFLSKQSLHQSS